MGRACSTHESFEKCIQNLLEHLKGRDLSEDLGADGKCRGRDVPVLFLTEHHAMEAYWGSGGIATLIL
jgi:hypothetical protein